MLYCVELEGLVAGVRQKGYADASGKFFSNTAPGRWHVDQARKVAWDWSQKRGWKAIVVSFKQVRLQSGLTVLATAQ